MKAILISLLGVILPATAQTNLPTERDRVLREVVDQMKDLVVATGSVVKNAPYSAEATTTTTQVFADGNRIEQSTSQKLYRDSQGRERREETPMAIGALAQPNAPMTIRISDPMERVSYTLDPQARTAQKIPGAAAGVRLFNGSTYELGLNVNFSTTVPAASDTTRKKEDLGTQTIEGVKAQGTRTTETIPAGQIGNVLPINIVDETWYSPELKMNILTTHSDPRSGTSTYKLTNISRSEQPRNLFEPPADYTLTGPGAGGRGRGPGPGPEHTIK